MHDARRSSAFRMYEQRVRNRSVSLWGGVKMAQQSLAEGRPADALKAFLSLVDACEGRDSEGGRLKLVIHGSCGNLLVCDSQYLKASKIYAKALRSTDEDDTVKGHLMHNIAVALVMNGNMEEALMWLRQKQVTFPFSASLRKSIEEGTLSPSTVPTNTLLDSLFTFSTAQSRYGSAHSTSLRPRTAIRPPLSGGLKASYEIPPGPVVPHVENATNSSTCAAPSIHPVHPPASMAPAPLARPRTAGFQLKSSMSHVVTPMWCRELSLHNVPTTVCSVSPLVPHGEVGDGYFSARWGTKGCMYLVKKYQKHDAATADLVKKVLQAASLNMPSVMKLKRVAIVQDCDVYFCYEHHNGTLLQEVEKGFIDPRVVVGMVRRLLHSIEAAGEGLTFGNALRPENLFVSSGKVVIGSPEAWDNTGKRPKHEDVSVVGDVARFILRKVPNDEEQAAASRYLLLPIINEIKHGEPEAPRALDVLGKSEVWRDLGNWLRERNMIVNKNNKIALLRGYLKELTRDRVEYFVVIERHDVREACAEMFNSLCGSDLVSPMNVTFAGEPAVDLGGVANELCTEYLKSLLPSCSSSTSAEATQCYLPSPSNSAKDMHALGRLVLKCLIDGRCLHFSFPPIFFKYLIPDHSYPTSPLDWLREMRHYDGVLYNSLKEMVNKSKSREYLESLCLCFPDGSPVDTCEKAGEYVRMTCKKKLVGDIKEQLEEVKKGFSVEEVTMGTLIGMLGACEVMTLVCGEEVVSGEAVVANIEFRNWEKGDSTPYYLCTLLRELPFSDLRDFLRLCTGTSTIPYGGIPNKISVFRSPNRFYSHTCFYQLSLPEYSSLDELSAALRTALTSLHLSPILADDELDV